MLGAFMDGLFTWLEEVYQAVVDEGCTCCLDWEAMCRKQTAVG